MTSPDGKTYMLWQPRGVQAATFFLTSLTTGEVVKRLATTCAAQNRQLELLALPPIDTGPEARKRIEFEILFYGKFLFGQLAQEVTIKRGLFGKKVDKLAFGSFIGGVRDVLNRTMFQQGLKEVRRLAPVAMPSAATEIITYQEAQPQSLILHVSELHPYAEAQRNERTAGPFGRGETVFGLRIAFAVRSPRIEVVAPAAAAYAPELVAVCKQALDAAVDGRGVPA